MNKTKAIIAIWTDLDPAEGKSAWDTGSYLIFDRREAVEYVRKGGSVRHVWVLN